MRGNFPPSMWVLLVLVLLILFVGIPWVIRHPPAHEVQTFGSSKSSEHH